MRNLQKRRIFFDFDRKSVKMYANHIVLKQTHRPHAAHVLAINYYCFQPDDDPHTLIKPIKSGV